MSMKADSNTGTNTETGNKRLYLKMYRTLVGIGTLCGIIIVLVYQFTAPMIRENKNIALENAIFKILPKATKKMAYALDESGKFVINDTLVIHERADILYAGYDAQQQLVGFAIPARGMGYQDSIDLLYAYEPISQTIVGIMVLQSRETPGLGSRIEDDVNFSRNFKQLDVRLNRNLTDLNNQLVMVKSGKKTESWQIDSITGATVSSHAVGKILQQSASRWLPIIKQHEEEFEVGH